MKPLTPLSIGAYLAQSALAFIGAAALLAILLASMYANSIEHDAVVATLPVGARVSVMLVVPSAGGGKFIVQLAIPVAS